MNVCALYVCTTIFVTMVHNISSVHVYEIAMNEMAKQYHVEIA